MASLHRYTDDFADAMTNDALHRLKTLIAGHIGNEDALLLAQHIIHDRSADGDFLLPIDAVTPAQCFGLELGAVGCGRFGSCPARGNIAQHDAAAIGVEKAKDQFENAFEQLIEVEDLADSLRRLIHEIGEGVLEPRPFDLFGMGEDSAAFGFADGLNDGRGQLQILPRDKANVIGEIAAYRRFPNAFAHAGGIDEKRLADLHLIARMQQHIADGLIVDEGAVGAAAIDDAIAVGGAHELGMAARHFGVLQLDAIGAIASSADMLAGQLELLAFIHTLDDDQPRQSVPPFYNGCGPRRLIFGGINRTPLAGAMSSITRTELGDMSGRGAIFLDHYVAERIQGETVIGWTTKRGLCP